MSEYQYYEFQAIDRPLTPEEQQAVARLSSRVDPHPRRAVFTYSWSDFPASAQDILARYYDAMLYMANWGSTQLMFRFPKGLVNVGRMRQYQVKALEYSSSAVTISTAGEYAVLDIQFHDEEGGDWIEGEGWLDALVPLRDDLLRGDDRLLYLAWLEGMAFEDDLDEDALEPPVPPGLGNLTPALESFVELFGVDEDWIRVAAEQSPEGKQTMPGEELQRSIARLSAEEKDAFLLRLAQGELHLELALRKRLREIAGPSRPAQVSRATRRTVGQLLAEVERRRELERKRRAKEAERKRIRELEALAGREAAVWQEVDALIEQKKSKSYKEAIQLLLKLRDLAEYKGRAAGFQERLREIREQYGGRSALMRHLDEAGLR